MKVRIIFIGYDGGNWVHSLEDCINDVFNKLGVEIFIISNRENPDPGRINVFNLSYFKTGISFQKISELKPGHFHIPEEIIQRQALYEKSRYRNEKISNEKIKEKLSRMIIRAEFVYKIIEPDLVIVWGGQYNLSGVYKFIAKKLNIPFYFAEKGMLPDSWYIDPKGINAQSSLMEKEFNFKAEKRYIDAFQRKIKNIDNLGKSAWSQPKRKNLFDLKENLGIKKGQKIIFFPGQVDYDSNIILFSYYFKNTLDALKWIANDITSEYFVLAKPHPMGIVTKDCFDKVIGNKGITLTDLNVIDAIHLSDVVITINSTVGFEASVRGKPVLLLGEGVLSNKIFVSKFTPDKRALYQINDCIEIYEKHKEEYLKQALTLGISLDLYYYSYRNDKKKSYQLLKGCIDKIFPKEKNFSFGEISALFKEVTPVDLNKYVPGKTILLGLLEKIKKRLKISKSTDTY